MYMTYHRGGNWGADSKNQKMRKIKRLVRATTRPPSFNFAHVAAWTNSWNLHQRTASPLRPAP